MLKFFYFCPITFIILGPIKSFALSAPSELDLNRVIEQSIEHNSDLKIALYTWLEKEGSLIKSKGDYDPKLEISVTHGKDDVPSSSALDGAGNAKSVKTETDSLATTLSSLLWTGTEIELPYTMDKTNSTSTSTVFKKSYAPSLGLTLTHPLIKGMLPSYWGKSVKEMDFDLRAGEFEKLEKINKTIHEVIKLYLDAREKKAAQKIKMASLETAKFNLEMVKAKKNVGSSSLIDFLEAQSDLSQKEEQLLSSEKDYQEKWHELLLNVFGPNKTESNLAEQEVFLESPETLEIEFLSENDWERILMRRFDIHESQVKLSKLDMQVSNSWWDLLPSLDFEGKLTNNGLNDDLGEAHEEVWRSRFTSYSVSLTSEYSLMSYAARSAHSMNELKLEQEKLKQEKLRREIFYQVLDDQKNFEVQKLRIKSYKNALDAETEKLNAYRQKFNLGEASAYDVIKAQQSKEESELELLKSKVGLLKSYFSLQYHRGDLVSKFSSLREFVSLHSTSLNGLDRQTLDGFDDSEKVDESSEETQEESSETF